MFSTFQCGFYEGFNAKHLLLFMIEKWCEVLDTGGEKSADSTDLSST